MDAADGLMARVEGYRQALVEAQRTLVGIPALGPTNGGQGELAKARVVQGWLEELGLDIQRVDAPDPRVEDGIRPNLVATAPGGDDAARWVLSHLDVVPPGPREEWDSDPWTLRVEGERLYGRGTLDDHAGLLASLFGLRAVLEEGLTPAGRAGLVVVSDEETGSAYGLEHVLETRPDLFTPRDLIVVPDGGDPEGLMIEVAEKSILWLRVEVTGRQVHGSTPDKGVNALYAAARMMVAAREMYQRFSLQDPLYHPPMSTFEPTKKEAGVPNVNTIPGRDVFYLDCRVLPQIRLEEVEAALNERFSQIAREQGAQVRISRVQYLPAPPPTPPQAPVVTALARAIQKVRGRPAYPGGVGGGTVAACFRQRGLPAAVWSTWPDTPHVPNEYCELGALVNDTKVFALFFAGL